MTDIPALIAANAARWKAMRVRVDASKVAGRLVSHKSEYLEVSGLTGVPWAVIAVIHEREASQSWAANIAQGDPWDKVSTHVPAGRGPFKSWKEAAVDALVNCAPRAAQWKDWSASGALTLLEKYNGLGYANKGRPSPYVWAGTDQYVSGKYVADGVYDPNAVDRQLGCAAMLTAMMALDPTIRFGAEAPVQPPKPKVPAKSGGAVVAGAGGAAAAHSGGLSVGWIIAIAIGCAILGVIIGHILTKPGATK
jgi:lysozyme family protein